MKNKIMFLGVSILGFTTYWFDNINNKIHQRTLSDQVTVLALAVIPILFYIIGLYQLLLGAYKKKLLKSDLLIAKKKPYELIQIGIRILLIPGLIGVSIASAILAIKGISWIAEPTMYLFSAVYAAILIKLSHDKIRIDNVKCEKQ